MFRLLQLLFCVKESFILESTYVGEEDPTPSELPSRFNLSYASCDRSKKKKLQNISGNQ